MKGSKRKLKLNPKVAIAKKLVKNCNEFSSYIALIMMTN